MNTCISKTKQNFQVFRLLWHRLFALKICSLNFLLMYASISVAYGNTERDSLPQATSEYLKSLYSTGKKKKERFGKNSCIKKLLRVT